MPAITKKETRLKLQFVANTDHTIHAGLVAVEAMARRFGLWDKLRRHRCLDPRKDRTRGYGPEVIAGQLIYALCSGGGCLSDSEALNNDALRRTTPCCAINPNAASRRSCPRRIGGATGYLIVTASSPATTGRTTWCAWVSATA